MITKTIKYVDFDGKEQEDSFQFNLTAAEIIRMDASHEGGLIAAMEKMMATSNVEKVYSILEKLLIDSVGCKSPDGKRFIKSDPDTVALFTESNAMSELIIEFLQTPDKIVEFVKGLTSSVSQSPQAISNHPTLQKV